MDGGDQEARDGALSEQGDWLTRGARFGKGRGASALKEPRCDLGEGGRWWGKGDGKAGWRWKKKESSPLQERFARNPRKKEERSEDD